MMEMMVKVIIYNDWVYDTDTGNGTYGYNIIEYANDSDNGDFGYENIEVPVAPNPMATLFIV